MDLSLRAPAPTDGVSFLVLVLLAVGLARRRDRRTHPWIMRVAFALDLGLVGFLELTRGAVERASEFASGLLAFHVLVAVLALVTNVYLLYSGTKILAGEDQRQPRHRQVAWVFVVLRLTTFVTAFAIPAR